MGLAEALEKEMKFNLGDKVFVKPLSKECVRVGAYFSYTKDNGYKTEYEVRHEEDYWNFDDCLPVSEYLGKMPCFARVVEQDIVPISDNDMLDAIRYATHAITNQKNFGITNDTIEEELLKAFEELTSQTFINMPSIEDLDRLAGESPSFTPTCSHEWKHYQGLMETYDFCSKCDVKKD